MMGRRSSATKNPADHRQRTAVLQTIGLVLLATLVLWVVVMSFQPS